MMRDTEGVSQCLLDGFVGRAVNRSRTNSHDKHPRVGPADVIDPCTGTDVNLETNQWAKSQLSPFSYW